MVKSKVMVKEGFGKPSTFEGMSEEELARTQNNLFKIRVTREETLVMDFLKQYKPNPMNTDSIIQYLTTHLPDPGPDIRARTRRALKGLMKRNLVLKTGIGKYRCR
jgi:hypothetical protein